MDELHDELQEESDYISHLDNAKVMIKDGLQELFNIGMKPTLILGFVAGCYNELIH